MQILSCPGLLVFIRCVGEEEVGGWLTSVVSGTEVRQVSCGTDVCDLLTLKRGRKSDGSPGDTRKE